MLTWTDSTLNLLLRRIAAACGPARMATLWRVLRQLAVSGVKEHFAAGVSPEGAAWKPLQSRSGLPLRDKGLLVASVREAGAVPNLTLVSSLKHAGVHQHGATIAKPERRRGKGEKPWVFQGREGKVFTRHIKAHTVHVPARPFLGISAKTAMAMARATETIALRPALEALRREQPSVSRNAKIREILELLRLARAGRMRPTGVKAA